MARLVAQTATAHRAVVKAMEASALPEGIVIRKDSEDTSSAPGRDGLEIERRFLVRVSSAAWTRLGEGRLFRQGYVRSVDPVVRIRVGEERGPVVTSKSGAGVRRTEAESVVNAAVADALFAAAGRAVIEKVRWRFGRWELDRFLGSLDGLELLEIELEEELEPLPPPPDGIKVLREVTDDGRFTSAGIAQMKAKKRRAFVRKVYRKVRGWKDTRTSR